MSEITVIEANSKKEFIDKVNLKLQQSFKIPSTNCGFVGIVNNMTIVVFFKQF